jgi:abortive infection bacteriophage resistance protein
MDNICLTCKHRKVLKSAAGYYIGATLDHKPYCRVSGYFASRELAKSALKNGYEFNDCIENYLVRKGILRCEVNND